MIHEIPGNLWHRNRNGQQANGAMHRKTCPEEGQSWGVSFVADVALAVLAFLALILPSHNFRNVFHHRSQRGANRTSSIKGPQRSFSFHSPLPYSNA